MSGCAGVDPITITKTEKQRVPESLLVPCPVSSLNGDSYQAAIELALARGVDLAECNKRIEDIRSWSAN